jgi:hypothetical protein
VPKQWYPQPGPQLAALEADWADEVFYGGERGGGKSDFQLGYQEDGALRYRENWRGIMFRKTTVELEELQGRAMEVFSASGATYKSQPSGDYPFSNCWYWPNGATVKMRYIENERDYGRYHGHSYCVGVDTPIWMADGSFKRIADICAGEWVATLGGARKVLGAVKPYVAPCVRLVLKHGSQIQPIWHPVLSSVSGIFGLQPDEFQTGGQLQPLNDPWLSAQLPFGAARNSQGCGAYSTGGQTDYRGSEDGRPKGQPRLRSSVPVVLVEQLVPLAQSQIAIPRHDLGTWLGWCWRKCQLLRPLWSVGPGEIHADGMGCIPEYSHRVLYRYIHPYTKAPQLGSLPLVSDTARIEFVGDALVCDLTIDGVNHYISDLGVINKNSGISFDEVTEYSTPNGLLKMLSTLRSAAGVPCTVRLTGNPGGVGHIWVKARYIDIGPPMTPYTDPETGFTRMFVPSRLQDNAILTKSDPGYRNRIMAATYGNEALRKAWLEGDWNIVAGAFFNCWSSQMVLRPVELPEWWTRFRSGDWGSMRPFSFGWWAIAGDTFEHPDGQIIPKGSLIRYREYYGCKDPTKNPNVGLKMPAEEVGQKIVHLESGEKVSYGVLDPAAFSSDGGPSIAERLYSGSGNKLLFRRADNARVGSKGAMGGWDQMRARMLGEDGRPLIYCFSNCTDSIRTIPMLQHDDVRVEDVNSDMEDHAGDEWRYACMSRPYVRPEPKKPAPPKFLAEMSLDELWKDTPKSTRSGRI